MLVGGQSVFVDHPLPVHYFLLFHYYVQWMTWWYSVLEGLVNQDTSWMIICSVATIDDSMAKQLDTHTLVNVIELD